MTDEVLSPLKSYRAQVSKNRALSESSPGNFWPSPLPLPPPLSRSPSAAGEGRGWEEGFCGGRLRRPPQNPSLIPPLPWPQGQGERGDQGG